MATVESILKNSQEPDDTKHLIRPQVMSLILTHKSRVSISRADQDAIKTLNAGRSIVVLPANKRRSTVVLDKAEYLRRAKVLLGDPNAYRQCDRDAMKKLVTQLNTALVGLQNNGAISKIERLNIKPSV
ncbi:unnamed protein product [Dibothriocephalus latus]|uniref:Uncharacterized protein n=1 Tax=Dibothriocephalus latus TaxID=60516 RepID=A0A3P6PLK1_DIBLA|nr:unnamed protein product [Dibothriocephalus latus]